MGSGKNEEFFETLVWLDEIYMGIHGTEIESGCRSWEHVYLQILLMFY
jgi:hypothetical protein